MNLKVIIVRMDGNVKVDLVPYKGEFFRALEGTMSTSSVKKGIFSSLLGLHDLRTKFLISEILGMMDAFYCNTT